MATGQRAYLSTAGMFLSSMCGTSRKGAESDFIRSCSNTNARPHDPSQDRVSGRWGLRIHTHCFPTTCVSHVTVVFKPQTILQDIAEDRTIPARTGFSENGVCATTIIIATLNLPCVPHIKDVSLTLRAYPSVNPYTSHVGPTRDY
jgi:hypothetical protein